MPIVVSPLSKFPPNISLTYNSQAGNGVAGYGWNISGLSSISLINHNLYYHDKVQAANLTNTNGVYALDGNPLVTNDDPTLSNEYALETARGHILVKRHGKLH